MKVSVEGKTFVAGLKWFSFPFKEIAKQKEKELKSLGKKAGTIKVSNDLYMVYAVEEGEENLPILATGFLWLSSGFYYLKLDDGRHWVFLKGKDGGILKEEISSSVEEFTERNITTLTSFSEENEAELTKPNEISLKEARGFIKVKVSGFNFPLKSVFVFTGIIMMIAMGGLAFKLFRSKPKPPPPPPPAIQPQPAPQPVVEKYALLDLGCYEEFYVKALSGEQNPSCSKTFQEVQEGAEEKACDGFIKVLSSVAVRNGGQVQWGQRGEKFLSFSYAGIAYARDLKPLTEYSYKSLTLSITGTEDAPQVSFSGVVLCR